MTYQTFAEAAKAIDDPQERILIDRIQRVESKFHTHPDQEILPLKKIHKLIKIWADSAEDLYLRQPKVGLPLLAETYGLRREFMKSNKYPRMLKPLRQLKSASRDIVNYYQIKDQVKDYLAAAPQPSRQEITL